MSRSFSQIFADLKIAHQSSDLERLQQLAGVGPLATRYEALHELALQELAGGKPTSGNLDCMESA